MSAARDLAPTPEGLDVDAIRNQFPILDQKVHGARLVYLDNGATTQKPQSVIDAVARYYQQDNANIHRGVHELSQRATDAYENARATVQRFIGASQRNEIVFVRGTTEAINLVANSFARPRLAEGDEILITHMEHHSNIVPWQMLCEQTGAVLKVVPVSDEGELDMQAFTELLGARTKMLAVVHVSNTLGTINPVRDIIEQAHAKGVPVLLDGAQAVAHMPVNVAELDVDFYAFSGHKLFGPTGNGALYGKRELLDAMPPWQGGGDMIRRVTFEGTQYADVPARFEAGTPNIAGAIGLGAAIEFVNSVGLTAIAAHDDELMAYATGRLAQIEGVRIIGTSTAKSGALSFVMDCAHAHDIGTILDNQGIAIRAGHHCTMPLMQRFGVAATARASFALYNTREEIDSLVGAIAKVREIFAR